MSVPPEHGKLGLRASTDIFFDMQGLVTLDQRSRIKVLAITPAQLKDMPNRMVFAKPHGRCQEGRRRSCPQESGPEARPGVQQAVEIRHCHNREH